jgi:hypothetical protein
MDQSDVAGGEKVPNFPFTWALNAIPEDSDRW